MDELATSGADLRGSATTVSASATIASDTEASASSATWPRAAGRRGAAFGLGLGLYFGPSFAPGLYHEGDGKDLGHPLEFKSEVQLSLDLFKNSELGFSYNHISNASLGDKNPGANSYMFNFLQKF